MRIERAFRCFSLCFFVLFVALLILLFVLGNEEPRIGTDMDDKTSQDSQRPEIREPIILWWTDGDDQLNEYLDCGDVRCFVTGNRNLTNDPQTKVFMFYGTTFKYYDLPLPRKPHHEWALVHEESPMNNFLFSFEDVMTLFNHTSTFRRESDYPLATQFLKSGEWLASTKHLLSAKEKSIQSERLKLAPVIFVNTDCGTGSDRDGYVQLLMKYVQVDSYGLCLHNRDLPQSLRDPLENMLDDEFFQLIAKYKFAIAIENAICEDYVTEKLWRPLHVGTIPIVLGSPRIKDLLPSNKSAIVVDDYDSVEDIARYINHLDSNDEEYDQYFNWKKTGITNDYLLKLLAARDWEVDYGPDVKGKDFFEGFECFVCRRVHENIRREKDGKDPLRYQAALNHYGCPAPVKVNDKGQRTLENHIFMESFTKHKYLAKALQYHLDKNLLVDKESIQQTADKISKTQGSLQHKRQSSV